MIRIGLGGAPVRMSKVPPTERAVGVPLGRASPARLLRVVPRMRVKAPPTKSVVPEVDRVRALTGPSTRPLNAATVVPVAFRAPRRLRAAPLRVVKEPPT